MKLISCLLVSFICMTMLTRISSYLPSNVGRGSIMKLRIKSFARSLQTSVNTASTSIEEDNPIFLSKQPFKDLCQSPKLLDLLQTRDYTIATDIQSKSYHLIADGKDVIVGAETGSGKTLAYFLPLIDRAIQQRIKALENNESESDAAISLHPKRGIILAPSTELCDQIIRMTRFIHQPLSDEKDFKVLMERRAEKCLSWIQNPDNTTTSRPSHNMYEIIVCTPRHLQDLIKKEDHRDPLHPLYHLDTLVLDEADMLLDGSYFADVEKIVKTLKLIRRYKIQDNVIQKTDRTVQYILAAASLPTYGLKSIEQSAKKLFPSAAYIKTNYLHQHHPKIKQEYIPLTSEEMDSPLTLLRVVLDKLGQVTTSTTSLPSSSSTAAEENEPPAWLEGLQSSVMIFFNTAQKAEYFADILRTDGHVPCVEMHSLLTREQKEENLQRFQKEEVRVMVCTDSCARGLDLPFVKYVVQAEFALNVVQHLHRVGRASRAGREGVAINFYHPSVSALVDSIQGKLNYDMQVGEGEEEKEGGVKKSSIEQSFSRRRGFRNKLKKRNNMNNEQTPRHTQGREKSHHYKSQ